MDLGLKTRDFFGQCLIHFIPLVAFSLKLLALLVEFDCEPSLFNITLFLFVGDNSLQFFDFKVLVLQHSFKFFLLLFLS